MKKISFFNPAHRRTFRLTPASAHPDCQGFTLIELAVVLAVVGLLLGGVLKGQELLHSARAKSIASDFRNTASFVYAYQDRFRALPGDDALVTSHLSGASLASSGGTVGNNRIEGAWNSQTLTDESLLFWQHVRLANLSSGDGNAPSSGTLDTWLPHNAQGGRIGITSTSPLSGWNSTFFVCQDSITGRQAAQVDTALDDGNTATGTVRSLQDNGSGLSVVSNTSLQESASYVVCAAY